MLLVYTPKITSRLKFIFKQICFRILGIPVDFTNKIEPFIAHDSLKISYGYQPLRNEFFVKSNGLLDEQGLSDITLNVQDWDNTKCFFYVGDKSDLPFDIFSAAFYLLSRYEEYLPHVKDSYGRFTKEESLGFKHDFLHQPVVDIWAYKFRKALQRRFPDYEFTQRIYTIDPIIDVPVAYRYQNKGFLRTIGGTFYDLFTFKFKNVYNRYMVLTGLRKDPFNVFNWILNRQKAVHQRFKIFFLIGAYTTYDKSINIQKKGFVSLIKYMSDYCHVGLKVSFLALDNLNILKSEKQNIEAVINTDLEIVRASFSKVNLPVTYRNMIELEITSDYTMGYPNTIGFRAGTCTPFLFYDIDYEIQTPLLIYPFQLMDFALLKNTSFLDKKETLERAMEQVKNVNGTFRFIFHNYSFGSKRRWANFKKLFNLILNSTDDISA
jgi:hypothetical protein